MFVKTCFSHAKSPGFLGVPHRQGSASSNVIISAGFEPRAVKRKTDIGLALRGHYFIHP